MVCQDQPPAKYLGKTSGAGVLSQSQVLLAFGVVAELFNGVRDAEPLDGKRQLTVMPMRILPHDADERQCLQQ